MQYHLVREFTVYFQQPRSRFFKKHLSNIGYQGLCFEKRNAILENYYGHNRIQQNPRIRGDLCITTLNHHYELFFGTHPGEVNGPRQWANPRLFEALGPGMNVKVAPDGLNRVTSLRSVLGFSERAHGWVKREGTLPPRPTSLVIRSVHAAV